jgi:hypothetical protein
MLLEMIIGVSMISRTLSRVAEGVVKVHVEDKKEKKCSDVIRTYRHENHLSITS